MKIAQAFADPARGLATAGVALRPILTISVTECARKHRKLNNPGGGLSGEWTEALVPYVVEPQDCLSTHDPCSMIVVQGPSQSGKTEIGLNWVLHSAIYDPARTLICQPTKEMTQDFMKTRVGDMLMTSPDFRRRQLDTQGADNVLFKHFRGGMFLWGAWPVGAQLRQRPVPRFWADDFDEFPRDIDGQGDFVQLARGRQTTFEGREKGLLTSSPLVGEDAGIERWWAQGTQKTWRWKCPHCEEYSQATFEHLKFEDKKSPEDAALSVHYECPVSGCVVEPKYKAQMNASGLWAGPEQTVTPEGKVEGPPRQSRVESFLIDGVMGFKSWSELARECREAEIHFESTQDEGPLRAFWNTRVGRNYVSRLGTDRIESPEKLKARQKTHGLRVVPFGALFLTAAVDIQVNRFEVGVKGWGANSESWWVDRFAIRQVEGNIDCRPDKVFEHWLTLLDLFKRRYALETEPDQGIPIAHVCIDTGGLPGVWENALQFGARLKQSGIPPWRFSLVKGAAQRNAPRIGAPIFAKDALGKNRTDVPQVFVCNVHVIKDQVAMRLNAPVPGPGFVHFPHDFADHHYKELAGEKKVDHEWTKTGPNETFDLEVYNEIARIKVDAGRVVNWLAPPEWAKKQKIETPLPPSETPKPETRQQRREVYWGERRGHGWFKQ